MASKSGRSAGPAAPAGWAGRARSSISGVGRLPRISRTVVGVDGDPGVARPPSRGWGEADGRPAVFTGVPAAAEVAGAPGAGRGSASTSFILLRTSFRPTSALPRSAQAVEGAGLERTSF